ncbi:unnamed protein product [Closterium sp. NIES-64]|nr:unnamed protein product [Closterium sp. NIES-64]
MSAVTMQTAAAVKPSAFVGSTSLKASQHKRLQMAAPSRASAAGVRCSAVRSERLWTPNSAANSGDIWSIKNDLEVPQSLFMGAPEVMAGQGAPPPMLQERFQSVISQLFQNRIIRCGGAVDDDMANLIVAQLLYLDAVDPTKVSQSQPSISSIGHQSCTSTRLVAPFALPSLPNSSHSLPLPFESTQKLPSLSLLSLNSSHSLPLPPSVPTNLITNAGHHQFRLVDIIMYVNSPGGSVTAGMAIDTMRHIWRDDSTIQSSQAPSLVLLPPTPFPPPIPHPRMAIFDTMRHIRPDVSTVCVGLAASMGAFLLSAGTKGKRYSLPNSRIMIHQPLGGAQGQQTDIEIQANEILHHKANLNGYLAYHTGQSYDQIVQDTDRDFFMSATEAKEYGLIDAVITNPLKALNAAPVAA